jgi:PAS domain S-box-containing protein
MYFMVDEAGTVLSVNPFGAEQLGYSVDELVGRSVLDVFDEADRDTVQRNIAACLEQLGRSVRWEIRKIRKDGAVLWVRETARATSIKEHPVVLIACEDITERKRAEVLTQQMFESSPDGVAVVALITGTAGSTRCTSGFGRCRPSESSACTSRTFWGRRCSRRRSSRG